MFKRLFVMKRFALWLSISVFSLALSGCSVTSNNTTNHAVTNSAWRQNAISPATSTKYSNGLSSFQENFPGAKILNVIHYKQQYILVDYQYPGTANHFAFGNLETMKWYPLPLSDDYTSLDKIVSPNDIVFNANGVASEIPQCVFPFIMVCTRKNANSQFDATKQAEYLNVNQSFTFTNGKQEELTSYDFTKNGIELQFGPYKNEPQGAFGARSTWIPTTHITYNRQKNQLILYLERTSIAGSFHVVKQPVNYINSVAVQTSQGGTCLVLQLEPVAKYYTANVTWQDSQRDVPELQVSFLSSYKR